MAEDKINELDDISIEILKTETHRAKNWKKKNYYPRTLRLLKI